MSASTPTGAFVARQGRHTDSWCVYTPKGKFMCASPEHGFAVRIANALNAQAQQPRSDALRLRDFADLMLEALRIAHARIQGEREIVLDSEGDGHPGMDWYADAQEMRQELTVIEAAMAAAEALRMEVTA